MVEDNMSEVEYEVDPELRPDVDGGEGDEDKYDGKAVSSIKFDPKQFELPDDYEEGDDDVNTV